MSELRAGWLKAREFADAVQEKFVLPAADHVKLGRLSMTQNYRILCTQFCKLWL
jgi:hypothetical protein